MLIKTDGLTIRETNVGENDRILTILTREKGVVSASARGSRKLKSRIAPASQILCHADFTLFKSKEKYIINEAEPLNFFMGVRKDIERLTLAQYFAQVCGYAVPEEEPAGTALRLALNSLHYLENGKRPQKLIKAVFEMRMLTDTGYMPDLVACAECGEFEDDVMYLRPQSGNLICSRCAGAAKEKYPLSKGALAAMRHTIYAEFERLFSFSLTGPALEQFSAAAEGYLLYQMGRSFPTLEFYHSLSAIG
ncbi:MAG TPA: DNA repair protein RecO [Clostridia bacterium]|nr:DNA repair protein RecO [Clostridia bacterium]